MKKLTYYRIVESILFYLFLGLGAALLYVLITPLVEMSRHLQNDATLNIVFLMVGIMLGARWTLLSKLFKK